MSAMPHTPPTASLSLEERLRIWPATDMQGDGLSSEYVENLMREAADALSPATERAAVVEECARATLAALVAAVSLLRRAEDSRGRPSRSVASDTMFRQMLADYDSTIEQTRAALAAAPAAPTGGQWEPIETAPKDGTLILCATNSGYVAILHYASAGFWRKDVFSKPGQWQPTHWMPLPPAPAQGGRA